LIFTFWSFPLFSFWGGVPCSGGCSLDLPSFPDDKVSVFSPFVLFLDPDYFPISCSGLCNAPLNPFSVSCVLPFFFPRLRLAIGCLFAPSLGPTFRDCLFRRFVCSFPFFSRSSSDCSTALVPSLLAFSSWVLLALPAGVVVAYECGLFPPSGGCLPRDAIGARFLYPARFRWRPFPPVVCCFRPRFFVSWFFRGFVLFFFLAPSKLLTCGPEIPAQRVCIAFLPHPFSSVQLGHTFCCRRYLASPSLPLYHIVFFC